MRDNKKKLAHFYYIATLALMLTIFIGSYNSRIKLQTVPTGASIQITVRKNELGLIGLYDIYKRNTATNGFLNLGPASTDSTTAYSMYITGVVPLGGQ